MPPLVTVRILTYNHERFIGACLEGVLRQTYRNLEILVVDDASTDRTEKVIRSFTDPRIRYIKREKNLGLIDNYNLALPLANGEFIWSVAGDDCLIDVKAIARSVDCLRSNPQCGFTFGPPKSNDTKAADYFNWGSNDHVFLDREICGKLINQNKICASTVCARAELYEKHGRFPSSFAYVGDWYRWFRFGCNSLNVMYVAQPTAFYRVHERNLHRIYSEKRGHELAVQFVQLRIAMLAWMQEHQQFTAEILHCLRKDLRNLLERWMNQSDQRRAIEDALLRGDLHLDSPMLRQSALRSVKESFRRVNKGFFLAAVRSVRPRYLMRVLELQRLLPRFLRAYQSLS